MPSQSHFIYQLFTNWPIGQAAATAVTCPCSRWMIWMGNIKNCRKNAPPFRCWILAPAGKLRPRSGVHFNGGGAGVLGVSTPIASEGRATSPGHRGTTPAHGCIKSDLGITHVPPSRFFTGLVQRQTTTRQTGEGESTRNRMRTSSSPSEYPRLRKRSLQNMRLSANR